MSKKSKRGKRPKPWEMPNKVTMPTAGTARGESVRYFIYGTAQAPKPPPIVRVGDTVWCVQTTTAERMTVSAVRQNRLVLTSARGAVAAVLPEEIVRDVRDAYQPFANGVNCFCVNDPTAWLAAMKDVCAQNAKAFQA